MSELETFEAIWQYFGSSMVDVRFHRCSLSFIFVWKMRLVELVDMFFIWSRSISNELVSNLGQSSWSCSNRPQISQRMFQKPEGSLQISWNTQGISQESLKDPRGGPGTGPKESRKGTVETSKKKDEFLSLLANRLRRKYWSVLGVGVSAKLFNFNGSLKSHAPASEIGATKGVDDTDASIGSIGNWLNHCAAEAKESLRILRGIL